MARTAAQIAAYRAKRLFVSTYKAEKGCAECGERDPVVLELHHTDPSTKTITAMQKNAAISLSWSLERIEREVQVCEVLCANCHRRKTAKEQGWG